MARRRDAIGSASIFADKEIGASAMKKKSTAVPASTNGYWMEMVLPQSRHRPRRRIHEKTGMRSCHRMVFLHEGHALRPKRERFPCRKMSTLRKLPIIKPNTPKRKASIDNEYNPAMGRFCLARGGITHDPRRGRGS